MKRNQPRLQDAVKFATPCARDWKEQTLSPALAALHNNPKKSRQLTRQLSAMMWPTPSAHKQTASGELTNADGLPWDGIKKPHGKTSGRPITTALADAVAMWGTPRASDGMKNKLRTISSDHDCRARLEDQVAQMEGAGGHLNPTWVEWLMGWPLGWTDLKPLETDRFQAWRRSHGRF
jgi:DNA (cytosine-5)-methyltransferase 1